jgi:5-methyltetrahydropteroyltriglutamate--homocysteine methyltransferase
MDLPLLPTTMVGSYPRPDWFRTQLEGRDVLEAFKVWRVQEGYEDATLAVIRDQEDAGLDVVADGQMWFDDYQMGIGAFLWYWLERIEGFGREKLAHPRRDRATGRDEWSLDEAGGVAVRGPIRRGPVRMATLYRLAARQTGRPVKACVGAGPVQLSTLAHFESGPVTDRYQLAAALAEVFAAEIGELLEAGCQYIQLEDLGAWIPTLSGEKDYAWVAETVNRTMAGARAGGARTAWHFCMGNAWGNRMEGMTRAGYREILPRYLEVDIDEYVLDFACREMDDAGILRQLPGDRRAAVGVIDVRTLEIEHPEQVAERIRKVLRHIDAARVTITTDCGMKQLPRAVARQKLRALVAGTRIVRAELARD